MTGDNDTTRGKIITLIPLMVRRVSEEDATSRTRCELVSCGGREVGIAGAPKDSHHGVVWFFLEQTSKGCGVVNDFVWCAIDEIGSSEECLIPEFQRHRSC